MYRGLSIMKTLLSIIVLTLLIQLCKAQVNKDTIHLIISYSYTSKYDMSFDSIKGKGCTGSIKIYTEEYVDPDKKQTNRNYQETFSLEPKSVSQVIKLFELLGIRSIKPWESGLDGTEYWIRFRKGNEAFDNVYWSPEAIKTSDGRTMDVFIDHVRAILNFTHIDIVFSSHLPFKCHHIKGGTDYTCFEKKH
jgi:hypothetical protein